MVNLERKKIYPNPYFFGIRSEKTSIWIRSICIKQRNRYIYIPVTESWFIHLLLGRKEGPDEEGARQEPRSYEYVVYLWMLIDKVATTKD